MRVRYVVGRSEAWIDRDALQALEAWGAWQSRSGGGGGRARSLEGRYRANAPAAPSAATPRQLDTRQMLAIERLIASLPPPQAGLLRDQFARGLDWRATCRRHGLHWDQLGRELERAAAQLRDGSLLTPPPKNLR